MPRSCRFVLAALLLAAIGPCLAGDDEFVRAESLKAGPFAPCPNDRDKEAPACVNGSLDRLAKNVEAAAKAALAKASPITIPLLKRDQVWFRDVMENYAGELGGLAEKSQNVDKMSALLNQRIAVLHGIAQGFGRTGIAGRWANVFGTVEIAPAKDGAFNITLATDSRYGDDDDQRQICKSAALVRPGTDGWLIGTPVADGEPARPDDGKPAGAEKPALLKVRLQGETLRVVAGDETRDDVDNRGLNCSVLNQLTGSYFASGTASAMHEPAAAAAPFAAPTFDCARPATASEEEICADPDLAANDRRLNQAWQKLLPRLDAVTRKLLTEDQRGFVNSQHSQYPEFLHPAWNKRLYYVHQTGHGRDKLYRLQLERIAVLEGFDEKRRGFEGLWMAYNATLTVTRADGGTLKALGHKWDQGDWKAGCGYEFGGKASGDNFRSDDGGKNPDTLERDHATLIVNRADDVLVKKREAAGGERDPDADEPKCRRIKSSTARLFPVRPSPDINNLGGSIR